jgi:4-alpha-glucanotransferase
VAALAIAPLQDVLGLGSEARMNTPGTEVGNWRWRLDPDELTPALASRLRALTEQSGRAA